MLTDGSESGVMNGGVNEEKDVLLPDHHQDDLISINNQDIELSDTRQDSPRTSSLFSSEASLEDLIKPEVLAVEGDQALIMPSTTTTSVKPIPIKNVDQENILKPKQLPPQDKMKQSAIADQSNDSHHSTGSEGSSYSFAFPVLVPGLPQRASRKPGAVNPQGKISLSGDDLNQDGENSISRPNQHSSTNKRSFCCCCCCCCCFPCRQSIFSSCF